jgi:hypothetical protein
MTYAALAFVIDTTELSGFQAFDAIQALFVPPALPLPAIGEYLHDNVMPSCISLYA